MEDLISLLGQGLVEAVALELNLCQFDETGEAAGNDVAESITQAIGTIWEARLRSRGGRRKAKARAPASVSDVSLDGS